MSDNSWILRGVDPESRDAAVAEAERRGISVADLLTEIVLGGGAEPQAPELDVESEALFAAPAPSRENLAFRRRIEALERRLASSVGGLEAAVQELDAAVIGAVARIDEAEAVTGETQEALRTALADIAGHIAAMRKRLTDLENDAELLEESNNAAHADLDQRCTTLETRLAEVGAIARNAAAAEVTLNAAYGALQQAVAQDFNAFVEDQDAHLGRAVEHMRAIAENAARGADEAAARAIEALRAARTELEQRVSHDLEETRAFIGASIEDVQIATLEANRKAEEASAAALETARSACNAIEQRVAEHTAQSQEQVQAAIDDVRVFAYEAARRADEAAARAVETLRVTREAIETSVAEQAADMRARMQDAFADAADRLGGLTERMVDTENAIVRSAQQLNTRIIDVEDKAQTQLDATAQRLRSEMGAAFADLMERQRGDNTRLNLLDTTIAHTAHDLEALRNSLDARMTELGEQVSAGLHVRGVELEARFAALGERVAQTEENLVDARAAASAELVRIEASTFAALEKLSQDIVAASAAQKQATQETRADMVRVETSTFSALEKFRQDIAAVAQAQKQAAQEQASRLEDGLAEGRDQIAGVLARLRLVDDARQEAEQRLVDLKQDVADLAAAAVAQKDDDTRSALAALEARVERDLAELRARTDQALRDLQSGLSTLAARARDDGAATLKIEELRVRLTANEAQAAEAVDRMHGLARMMSRVTAQSADVSDQTEERLHKLEQSIAESRGGAEAALEMNERLAAFERRQADALEGVRAALARFMAESEQRLTQIEHHAASAPLTDETLIAQAIEARLTALEQLDVSAQMELLRRRFEERLTGLEGRSVRALEQVAETVAHIENRFASGAADSDMRAHSA